MPERFALHELLVPEAREVVFADRLQPMPMREGRIQEAPDRVAAATGLRLMRLSGAFASIPARP